MDGSAVLLNPFYQIGPYYVGRRHRPLPQDALFQEPPPSTIVRAKAPRSRLSWLITYMPHFYVEVRFQKSMKAGSGLLS
jgi:hypothetical protein